MRVSLSIVRERQNRIEKLLQNEHYLSLSAISKALKVSEATIRRDLAYLESHNRIKRTYGGAVTSYNESFESFGERQKKQSEAKYEIARKAFAHIRPDTTIYLDFGTTIYALARVLSQKKIKGLKIVTNSLPILQLLGPPRLYELHLLGGQYLDRQCLVVGSEAANAIKRWRFDSAFLSAEGVDESGIWNSQTDIALMQKNAIRQSKHNFICLDDSKLGRNAPTFLIPLSDKFKIITNVPEEDLKSQQLNYIITKL